MDWLEFVDIAPHTTLQVGSVVRYYAEINNNDELLLAVDEIKERDLPFFVLGGGSNVLFTDEIYNGSVIKINTKGIIYEDQGETVLATVLAGELLDDCIIEFVNKGYSGLENLSGIPGTVGATPVQNVGAYGVEVSDVIVSVNIYDTVDQCFRKFLAKDCSFGYRNSLFKTESGKRYIITEVAFLLKKNFTPQISYKDLQIYFDDRTPNIKEVRDAICFIRNKKFPDWSQVGTAGSFFKNPIVTKEVAERLLLEDKELPVYDDSSGMKKISLGYLLDKWCNLKGYCRDGVCLYKEQALVLTAEFGTTSEEILNFVNHIKKVVYEKTGVIIECEVEFVNNK